MKFDIIILLLISLSGILIIIALDNHDKKVKELKRNIIEHKPLVCKTSTYRKYTYKFEDDFVVLSKIIPEMENGNLKIEDKAYLLTSLECSILKN